MAAHDAMLLGPAHGAGVHAGTKTRSEQESFGHGGAQRPQKARKLEKKPDADMNSSGEEEEQQQQRENAKKQKSEQKNTMTNILLLILQPLLGQDRVGQMPAIEGHMQCEFGVCHRQGMVLRQRKFLLILQ